MKLLKLRQKLYCQQPQKLKTLAYKPKLELCSEIEPFQNLIQNVIKIFCKIYHLTSILNRE